MQITGKIAKADAERCLVFGWASVAADVDGNTVVDHAGDVIPIDELERAAYNFVRYYGYGCEMHERDDVVACVVESMVFTPDKIAALGLEGKVPVGWWVGFKVTDADVWQKIRSGAYSMFSIGGRAVRSELNESTDES